MSRKNSAPSTKSNWGGSSDWQTGALATTPPQHKDTSVIIILTLNEKDKNLTLNLTYIFRKTKKLTLNLTYIFKQWQHKSSVISSSVMSYSMTTLIKIDNTFYLIICPLLISQLFFFSHTYNIYIFLIPGFISPLQGLVAVSVVTGLLQGCVVDMLHLLLLCLPWHLNLKWVLSRILLCIFLSEIFRFHLFTCHMLGVWRAKTPGRSQYFFWWSGKLCSCFTLCRKGSITWIQD